LYATTLREAAGPIHYNVSLPDAGLGWEKVGPLFERYSVRLVGPVDTNWADAYMRVVGATPGLQRFRLDKERLTVSFTCRATDGPVEVMGVLKILEGVLERVNREASIAAAGPPGKPEAALAERADPRLVGARSRSRAAGSARSLLSK
jgi:hypothetical protein